MLRSKCSGQSCVRVGGTGNRAQLLEHRARKAEPVAEQPRRVRIDGERGVGLDRHRGLVEIGRRSGLDADETRRGNRGDRRALFATVAHHDDVGTLHAHLLVEPEERRTEPARGVAQADLAVGESPRRSHHVLGNRVQRVAGRRQSVAVRERGKPSPRAEPAVGAPVGEVRFLACELVPCEIAVGHRGEQRETGDASSGATGSSANHGGSFTAGGDGSSTRTSNRPPTRSNASRRASTVTPRPGSGFPPRTRRCSGSSPEIRG